MGITTQNLDEKTVTPSVEHCIHQTAHLWRYMLAVALAYFALAHLSAIPLSLPDYISMLWMPAGLGAFVANLLLSSGAVLGNGSNSTMLLTAILTASGSTAQALIGSYLARPFVEAQGPLNYLRSSILVPTLCTQVRCNNASYNRYIYCGGAFNQYRPMTD